MIIFILKLLLIFFILLDLPYRSCRRTILEKHVSTWSRLLSSCLRSVIILGAKMIIWWWQISWFLSSRQLNSKSLLKKEQHKRVISSLSLVKLFQAKSRPKKKKTAPHTQIFINIVLEPSISYLLDFYQWKNLYEEKLPNLFLSFFSSIAHATHTISKLHRKYRQF